MFNQLSNFSLTCKPKFGTDAADMVCELHENRLQLTGLTLTGHVVSPENTTKLISQSRKNKAIKE